MPRNATSCIQYPVLTGNARRPHDTADGAARARLARLAGARDEPGGDELLARMGDLGDWLVDFVFGEVHARPGLDARERELIILSALTTLGVPTAGARAHVRALRALGVSFAEIEEAILQTAPYAGFPPGDQRSRCCATSRRRSREGRTVRPPSRGADRRLRRRPRPRRRLGRPERLRPDARGRRALVAADGPEYDLGDVRLLHPVVLEKILAIGVHRSHADESARGVPVVFGGASALVDLDEDIVIPHEEYSPRLRGRGRRRSASACTRPTRSRHVA